jgi:phosphatidylserine/phosphatidylglycerophosphate/cardiolipin synthase-like enzyme
MDNMHLPFFPRPRSSYEKHHYGNDSYRIIDRVVNSAGTIYLVSPYLDIHYAKMMTKNRRAKFYVISSSIGNDAYRLMARKRYISKRRIACGTLLSIASYAALQVFYHLPGTFAITLPIAIAAISLMLSVSKSNITIKKPKKFIHSKFYVCDSLAIEGSANLTYSGTHRNIEQISYTGDAKRINALREEFEKLWTD